MLNLKINFDDKTSQIIKMLALKSREFGANIYFVGGIVRDALLGIAPSDIDIVVAGNAIDFALFMGEDIELVSIHQDFFTAKIIVDGIEIDLASTRIENYPQAGCLPQVERFGCSIQEDLIRRDFSINSIAARINPDLTYEIIDIYEGQKDLAAKTLRVLHKYSYIDDPTRILRGLDFSLRFGFDFSHQDKNLIKEALSAPNRTGLSVDRVVTTLKKLFSNTKTQADAFFLFLNREYYKILFDNFKFNIASLNMAFDIFKVENRTKLYLNYVLSDEIIAFKLHSVLDIYKYFKNFSDEKLCLYYSKTEDNNAVVYFREYKNTKVLINGDDLKTLGYQEGKVIGDILDMVLEQKLLKNPMLKTKQDEIDFIKRTYS